VFEWRSRAQPAERAQVDHPSREEMVRNRHANRYVLRDLRSRFASQLFEVSAHNPALLGGATISARGHRVFACLLPARPRGNVDPVQALAPSSVYARRFQICSAASAEIAGFYRLAVLTLALGVVGTRRFFRSRGNLAASPSISAPEQLVRIYESPDEVGARAASMNLTDHTVARFVSWAHIFEMSRVARAAPQ